MIIESGYRRQRLNCLQTFKHHALTHFTHSHTYAGSCQALYTHISMSAYKASESRHRLHLHKHKNYTSIDPKQLKQYQCKNLLSHMNQTFKVQGHTFKVEKFTSEVQKYTFEVQKYTFEVQKYTFEVRNYTFKGQKDTFEVSARIYFESRKVYFRRTKV